MLVFIQASVYSQVPKTALSSGELGCLERLIYFNECSGRPEKLITWSQDEGFPSLGIGHFIWYPPGVKGPYRESFPEMVVFLKKNGVKVPSWIEDGSPWRDREAFEKDLRSERMASLRALLEQTRDLQVQWIVARLNQVFPRMLELTPKEERLLFKKKFDLVGSSVNGMFAMLDYVNFKGGGTLLTERLEGHGWGLFQVLQEMKVPQNGTDALVEFVDAAERVLEERVKLQKDERPHLKGWETRVHSYLKIAC